VEDGGSERLGFEFVEDGVVEGEDGGKKELLVCKEENEEGEQVWRGWMAVERWASGCGYAELFWVTDKLKGELPSFCHRVRIVREML